MKLPFLALALAALAIPAAAQVVDHYDMSRVGNRDAYGQAAYPAGVNDPSRVNPPAPPTEVAVPLPPPPGTPLRSVPTIVPAGGTSAPVPALEPAAQASGRASSVAGASGFNYGTGSSSYAAPVPAYGQPTQVYPPVIAPPAVIAPPSQASWYTRVDYFHWNERISGIDFVNESGALFTLGYQRQIGIERFRAELFGGDVHYDGYGQFDTGLETLPSNTGYLGLRGEYELVLAPAIWQGRIAFLLGLGTRFWIRDLHDGATVEGDPVYGYQESWWTIYPYLGLETHWSAGENLDLYAESRVGMTAVTYDYASIGDRPLWPRPGLIANLEVGLRGPRFYIAARSEVMSWEQSSDVQDAFQPHSIMYTVGGQLGWIF